MIDLRALATADRLPIAIPADTRLTLIAVALDDPLDYIFESADWQAAIGAAKLVQSVATRINSALPTDQALISASEESGRWVALVADLASEWASIVQLAPTLAGTLTATAAGLSLTARQVFGGLYRAPTAIIGIPGMAAHQARVNHYYGMTNGTTLPDAAQIADRRHFGESLTLIDHLIDRARAERDTFPFIECLPVVVRCEICHLRPADVDSRSSALCTMCRQKRSAAGVIPPANTPLTVIGAQAIGIDGTPIEAILRRSTTPAAYLRMSRALAKGWAAPDREADRSIAPIPLWRSFGQSWWIVPTVHALTFAAVIAKQFTSSWPDDLPRLTVHIGLGCDQSHQAGARNTYYTATDVLARLGATHDRPPLRPTIGIGSGWSINNSVTRYTPDMIVRMQDAVSRLHKSGVDVHPFADLPSQIGRHTAHLYYEAISARLDNSSRTALDAINADFARIWGAQTDAFFAALSDTFGLVAALDTPGVRAR